MLVPALLDLDYSDPLNNFDDSANRLLDIHFRSACPQAKANRRVQPIIRHAHRYKGRRQAGRSTSTGRSKRNGNAGKVKLHQECIAIETHEAKIDGLRKAQCRISRAVADNSICANRNNQARFQTVAECKPAGRIRVSRSACQCSKATARPTARGTGIVPGRRPCCCPPPTSQDLSLNPLRTSRSPTPSGP